MDPEFRAGRERWRNVSAALHSRVRGSCADTDAELKRVYPSTWTKYSPRPIGLIGWLARQVSPTYSDEPSISYLDPETRNPLDDKVVAAIKRYRDEAGITSALLAAHEEMFAAGNATVWMLPVTRTVDGRPLMSVVATCVPAHQQWVTLQPNARFSSDERDVSEWQVYLPLAGASDTDGLACITPTEAVWAGTGTDLDGKPVWDRPSEDGPTNPLGQIPAVVVRWAPPDVGDFWAQAREELLWQARALDAANTDMGEVVRHQGFGQYWTKGVHGAGTLKLGFGIVVELQKDGEIGCLSPTPDLAGSRESIEAYTRMAVASQDGNPATLIRSTAITAEGKKIEIQDRESLRKRHLREFRRAEQRLYDLLRAWLRVLRGTEVLPAAVLEIEYPGPDLPDNELQAEQAAEKRIQLGQSSEIRERMRRDRCSYAEAKKRVLEDVKWAGEVRRARIEAGLEDAAVATPTQATSDPSASSVEVQKTALNGAQVTSLQLMLEALGTRRLPRAAVERMILLSFPAFDVGEVKAMLDAFDGFEPAASAAPVAANAPVSPTVDVAEDGA